MTNPAVIRPRDRDAVLRALRAGTVPRVGVQHVQVGRSGEVRALVDDLAVVADGGGTFRLLVAPWGAGKTFLAHVADTVALAQNFCTVRADLGPDRRLSGSNGEGRALWRALIASMATRSRPDGGALAGVLQRFVTGVGEEAQRTGVAVGTVLGDRLSALTRLGPGAYALRDVIAAYWDGYQRDDDTVQTDVLRWLGGEFDTRSDARDALGVRMLLGDGDLSDALQLLAGFVKLAGYAGLVAVLDEFVHIHNLASPQARARNYDALLGIFNGITQGFVAHLGVLIAATPETMYHPRRGICSNPALASRLTPSDYATGGLVDHAGPVISLAPLSPEELVVLLTNIRHIYTAADDEHAVVPDEALRAFLDARATRLGDDVFRTPRDTIRAFVQLLDTLTQNPQVSWRELINRTEPEPADDLDTLAIEDSKPPVPMAATPDDDSLVDFTL